MAARLMLLRNGTSSPLHFLLLGSASCVSKLNDIADPKLLFQFHQTPVFGHSNAGAKDVAGAFFQGDHLVRFGGFGEIDKLQLRENKKVVPIDGYDDDEAFDNGEEFDDGNDDDKDFEAEDFTDEDFDDDDEDDD